LFATVPEKVVKMFRQVFEPKEPDSARWKGPVGELKDFLGEPVWVTTCPECLGRAAVSESVRCAECDSDGFVRPGIRPGWLGECAVDRNLVAQFLAGIPRQGSLTIYYSNPKDRILLVGDWWRVSAMGLDFDEAHALRDAPCLFGKPPAEKAGCVPEIEAPF
jgi:hypothetical protein